MKITSIEAIPFRLPPRRDFRWAGLRVQLGGFVLVRIGTDDGIVGYGEATPLPDWGGDDGRRGGETQGTVVAVIDGCLGPALIGRDPTAVTAAMALADTVLVGHSYAKCAIDIALHDIWGKSLGVPIHRLLGGAVRASVPIAHMIGLMPERDALDEGLAAARDGVKALQIKGGEDPARDIRLVRDLSRELGGEVALRLDANQGYRDVKTASLTIRALESAGLHFVEQPVGGLRRMAEVVRLSALPVIADESCWDARDAVEIATSRAADCISIYLAKAGGFVGARRVATVAETAGLRCDVNGSIESGIGNAANVQLALAMRAIELPAVIPISAPHGRHPCKVAGRYYDDDIVKEPFETVGCDILPASGPGLGIEIDDDKLERYRCRS